MEWIALASLLTPLAISAATAVAYQGLMVLKQKGYQTTYAEALVRAVGSGAAAAQNQGMSLNTSQGRAVAVMQGVKYLMDTVPSASAALGIGEADHAPRVEAQMTAMQLIAPPTSPLIATMPVPDEKTQQPTSPLLASFGRQPAA